MEIKGAKCTLRHWRWGDEEALARYANNRKIWRNMLDRFPHPYTIEEANCWISKRIDNTPPYNNFVIDVDGELVGGLGFEILPENHRVTARAGYWLAEPFWGRGIVTEAFTLFRDYIFTMFPDIQRIEATVFEWNPASARVLEKCGFTREARMRKACIKDGEVIDVYLYACVRPGPD